MDTYTKPEHGWTCFHCGETFTKVGVARDHFGAMPDVIPGCMLRVQKEDELGILMSLRKAESTIKDMKQDADIMHELIEHMRICGECADMDITCCSIGMPLWDKYVSMIIGYL